MTKIFFDFLTIEYFDLCRNLWFLFQFQRAIYFFFYFLFFLFQNFNFLS